VHGIVKEHGGDVCVYSEVGKGTVFHVYLPEIEDTENSRIAAVTREYPTGSQSILLIDDEAPILQIVQMMLEKLGYQVTARSSSLDALDAFKADPIRFYLVISDRGMPNNSCECTSKQSVF
jgi:PleD family two-component response regulator